MRKGLFLILVQCLVLSSSARSEAQFQQIALSGESAPGVSDGAEYDSFSSLRLNAVNDVAFRTGLRTGTGPEVTFINDAAIYRSDKSAAPSPSLVIREGEPVPGASDGAIFDTMPIDFSFNIAGDLAFEVGLRTGSGPVVGFDRDSGVFGPTSGAGSPLGLLVREGDPAPGALDGAEFNLFSGAPYLNDAGDVAFLSFLRTGTGAAVVTSGDDSNVHAVFGPIAGTGSPLGLLLRANDPAPGALDGAEISNPSLFGLNAAGGVVINTSLRTGTGAPVQTTGFDSNDRALLGPIPGGLGMVIREGDVPDGVSDDAEVSQFSAPTMNAAGDITTEMNLRVETSPGVFDYTVPAIFSPVAGSGSTPGIVARQDCPAPGTGGAQYENFSSRPPGLNSAGDLAFEAFLKTGTGTATEADNNTIFGPTAGVGSALGLVAREGNTAPGVDDAAQFDNFSAPVLNDVGDLAFFADLQTGDPLNPVDPSNDFGLFAYVDGQLELIVRTGDLVDVQFNGAVESRTVSGIGFSGTDVNNARVSFNQNGLLAFGLEFTDSSSGVFVTQVVELGDFNIDEAVDAADYALWRSDPNSYGGAQGYTDWVNNFGQTAGSGPEASTSAPEPATWLLLIVGAAFGFGRGRRVAARMPTTR